VCQRPGQIGPGIQHGTLLLFAVIVLGAGKVLNLVLDQFARPILGPQLYQAQRIARREVLRKSSRAG
jgi:hypothetical protein